MKSLRDEILLRKVKGGGFDFIQTRLDFILQSRISLIVATVQTQTKSDKNIFFIQAAGLVYHRRAKCGVYHQPLRGCISSRASVYLPAV